MLRHMITLSKRQRLHWEYLAATYPYLSENDLIWQVATRRQKVGLLVYGFCFAFLVMAGVYVILLTLCACS